MICPCYSILQIEDENAISRAITLWHFPWQYTSELPKAVKLFWCPDIIILQDPGEYDLDYWTENTHLCPQRQPSRPLTCTVSLITLNKPSACIPWLRGHYRSILYLHQIASLCLRYAVKGMIVTWKASSIQDDIDKKYIHKLAVTQPLPCMVQRKY